ncbi:hypothetical protein CRE_04421 [Caenorhabditis remanei]|uniref:Uncharacterized protein n=2 Tax=Caenorhabditis remanei TaxID=31234 RepID=E3NNT6_CAERE|nr:hypothetical protein CRE_04421 [Caenorhabditis remanei]
MSQNSESARSPTPHTRNAPRQTISSTMSQTASAPPSYEESTSIATRPLRGNMIPREFQSDASILEAKSTPSTTSSSLTGPLSIIGQIRQRCEPIARALMGTPQLSDQTTPDSSTSSDLKEIKSLLQSIVQDVEILKEKASAPSEQMEQGSREPLAASASIAMRFAGDIRPLDSRVYVQIKTASKVLHMLFQPVGEYVHLMYSSTSTPAQANSEEDRFLRDIQKWRQSWKTGLTWTAYTVWKPPTTQSALPYTHFRPCRCIPSLLLGNERHGDSKTCSTRRLGQEVLIAALHNLVVGNGPLMPLSIRIFWDSNQLAAPYFTSTHHNKALTMGRKNSTSILIPDVRETVDIVRDIRDKVDDETTNDLVRDVLDKLESREQLKALEVAPLLMPEMKKIGKLVAKTGEETQTAIVKQIEALVSKVTAVAQSQHATQISTIVRSMEDKMAAIIAPLKSEVTRLADRDQRPLQREKDREKSQKPLQSVSQTTINKNQFHSFQNHCLFCERGNHSTESCRTVMTCSDRLATAKAKGICTRCLNKFNDNGFGHSACPKADALCTNCSSIMTDTAMSAHHEAFCAIKKSATSSRRRPEANHSGDYKKPRYSTDGNNKPGTSGTAPR